MILMVIQVGVGARNYGYIDGLVQNCSISSASAMEILQFYTKPPIKTSMRLWYLRICTVGPKMI